MTGRVAADGGRGDELGGHITARGRTQRRAAEELTGRAERDARIAAAAAQVSAARDAIRGNAERRALALAAAQQAIAIAERAEKDSNAAADQQILPAVRQLRADGLNVAKIADLLHLPVPQVRQYITRAHSTNGGAGAAASTGTAAPETDQAG